MTLFYICLIGFFGLHFFSALRSRADGKDIRKRMGEARYMGLYSLLSLAFFIVMLVGYGGAPEGAPLWVGPSIAYTLALPLNVIALILLAAAYAPTGKIKRAVHHPMMFGVLIWSLSHLLIGGDLPKVLLFGAFAAYSAVSIIAAFRRGDKVDAFPRTFGDIMAVLGGGTASLALIYGGHALIAGVSLS
ncbi:MAG: NnrU family protein [Pseudomonadota bacterium]